MNAQPGSEIELKLVLDQLARQTYPIENLEIIIIIEKGYEELISFLNDHYSYCKQVYIKDPTYNSIKFLGIKTAQGDIISLLDSDCIPVEDWAVSIVESVNNGADIVAGKTVFSKVRGFSKLFTYFSFGHVYNNEKGEANIFIPNNCAFTKEVANKMQFDARRKRDLSAPILTYELKKQNFKLVYNPRQFVSHFNYGLRYHITNRFRSGFEAVQDCQHDTNKAVPLSKYLKFGIVFPFISAASRFKHDLKTLFTNRENVNISYLEIPIFLVSCLIIRIYEIIPGIITIISPSYLKKKYNW